MTQTGRAGTTQRDRDRAAIRRTKPPCGICGSEIDYTLRWPNVECFVVDHIVPINRGGADVIENKQAAHSRCNRAKSDKMPDAADAVAPRTFVTSRRW